MKCRSLEPDIDLQKKLLGKPLLLNREKMQAFLSIVSGDDDLQKALKQCNRRKSLKPLKQYRQKLESEDDTDHSLKLKRLWKLLELKTAE
ncbi:MAG: hypothetical protein IH899_12440 [Planctomycetes bacterium]|nr:hypothetical protein [Planctomycetota bacterium]